MLFATLMWLEGLVTLHPSSPFMAAETWSMILADLLTFASNRIMLIITSFSVTSLKRFRVQNGPAQMLPNY